MRNPELLDDFSEETLEHVEAVEPRLIEYLHAQEAEGGLDEATLDLAFRLFHTLKGNCSYLKLEVVGGVAHRAEDLLDHIRHGRVELSQEIVDLLCQVLDFVRLVLGALPESQSDQEFAPQSERLRQALTAAMQGDTPVAGGGNDTPAPAPVGQPSPRQSSSPEQSAPTEDMRSEFVVEGDEQLQAAIHAVMEAAESPGQRQRHLAECYRAIHSFKGNCGFMGLHDAVLLCSALETVIGDLQEGDLTFRDDTDGLLLTILDVLRETVASISQGDDGSIDDASSYLRYLNLYAESHQRTGPQAGRPSADAASASAEETEPDDPAEKVAVPGRAGGEPRPVLRQDVRVKLEKLDELINTVGELVIAETMVSRHPALLDIEDEGLARAIHQLRRVSADLQHIAMAVRMVPLSGTFRKMIRLVHDVSERQGKEVRLMLEGEDTEVDKTVIEQIADPLVHLVRNAIDHGIESAAEREAAGKPAIGQLSISGRHEGGEVWITIEDDGRGLDRQKILARAIDRGLLPADHGELTDGQIYRLVFEPGFSTAAKVSDISGRGVGMDVVRTNIEELQGRVDLQSQPGQGTSVLLRLPLTLAIIDGMLVRVGNARYTIPMLSIRESFRPTQEQITRTPDQQEVVRLRDELIPVLRLHEIFDKEPDRERLEDGILIVVEDAGQTLCLFVDEVDGQQQTVIKGLSTYLGDARAISGCTILGDGRVSLIVDIRGILRLRRNNWEAA